MLRCTLHVVERQLSSGTRDVTSSLLFITLQSYSKRNDGGEANKLRLRKNVPYLGLTEIQAKEFYRSY
jgi:hypothetical protein